MKAFLAIDHLALGYTGKVVVQVEHLEAHAGEVFILLGRSGSGKSTLLRSIAGLIRPYQGTIRLGDTEVTSLPAHERKKFFNQVGIVFQEGALFDSMTTEQNISFPLRRKAVPRKEWGPRVISLLHAVGLTAETLELLPSELSGGMKRRVGLARALAAEPHVVLFDEPTAGLDPITAGLIGQLIRQVSQKVRLTVIATHDLNLVEDVGDRIALVESGRILTVVNRERFLNLFAGNEAAQDAGSAALQQFLEGSPKGPLDVGGVSA